MHLLQYCFFSQVMCFLGNVLTPIIKRPWLKHLMGHERKKLKKITIDCYVVDLKTWFGVPIGRVKNILHVVVRIRKINHPPTFRAIQPTSDDHFVGGEQYPRTALARTYVILYYTYTAFGSFRKYRIIILYYLKYDVRYYFV